MGKILHGIVQRFCKCFDKGTASGGTGFVQLYAVNGLVFDLDTFHILTADVEYTVHIRFKERSGIVMGHRFHFALIQKQRGFDQCLAVACGAGVDDLYIFREPAVNIFDRGDRCA